MLMERSENCPSTWSGKERDRVKKRRFIEAVGLEGSILEYISKLVSTP